jgi:hypothetical protein
MYDIKHKKCLTYLCNTRVEDKYEGYCLYCFINLFPDKNISRNYKTKETAVKEYILNNFSEYTWISDKKIENGCSKRRPDLLLDLGYQIIIIEIDEFQHNDYADICENKRIMEISKDLNHRPIIFIRFNPDDYIDLNGNKINSCWYINNKGLCVIKKSHNNLWNTRLEKLKDTILFWINDENKIDKSINIVNLFFDK